MQAAQTSPSSHPAQDTSNSPPSLSDKLKSRNWMIKFAVIIFAVFWLSLIAASWADAADNGDEYNFNWLDPEKKIYVLQNRRYAKAGHPMLSLTGGPGFSNPYRTTYNIDPRVAYYFSESIGIELFYTIMTNSENNTFDALKVSAPSSLPEVREIRAQYGAMFQWVPWYAKINVFNNILYFDWYFSAGLGSVHTAVDQRTSSSSASNFVNEDLIALFLGTGHLYHLGHRFLVRLDFTTAIYKAEYTRNSTDTALFSNSNLGIGFGVKF